MEFARDTQVEVRKVVWPTRQETVRTTAVVIVVVLITAVFLWVLDLMLGGITRWLMGHGG
jgi:preprotein translocase subunit SecE